MSNPFFALLEVFCVGLILLAIGFGIYGLWVWL